MNTVRFPVFRFTPTEILESRIAPATLTWVGDVDDNWGTNIAGNTNWSGNQIPQDGDSLIFAVTGSNHTNSNNIAGLALVSITFSGSDYDIDGIAITLSGGISDTSSAGENVLDLAIAL